jgi:hypothetical protein
VSEPGFDVLGDTVAHFSSRGPSRFAPGLKPQVLAPGLRVNSGAMGTGSGQKTESGTFISSAVASGAAALLWQRNQRDNLGLEADDIGALLMNHANPVVRIDRSDDAGLLAPVARAGAGRLDVLAAAQSHTVARSERGLAEIHFGYVPVTAEPATRSERVTVRNFGPAAARYAVGWAFRYPAEDGGAGVAVSVSPAELQLAPGAAGEIEVTVTVQPAAVRQWTLYGREAVMNPDVVRELEVDGYVTISEVGGGDRIDVPFLVLPRRHSCVRALTTGAFQIAREGDAIDQSWTNACAEKGWVDQYVQVATDPDDPNIPAALDILSVGYRRFLSDPNDPQSDYIMEWLVRTRGPRPTPESAQFRILIDVTDDGQFDTVVYNLNAAEIGQYVEETFQEGRWLNAQASLVEGTLEPNNFDIRAWAYQPYQIDETTTVLLANADEMGFDLRSGYTSFRFGVMAVDVAGDYPRTDFDGYDRVPNDLEQGGRVTYDQAVHDCFSFEPRLAVEGGATVSSEVSFYCTAVPSDQSIAILSVYAANAPGLGAAETRVGRYSAAPREIPVLLPFTSNRYVLP